MRLWKRPVTLALPASLEQGLVDLHYSAFPAALRPGNRIEPLWGGAEAFPAMLAAIAGAREHVNLETYIYRADRTGRRFAAALAERARAGVAVRLLIDAVGSYGLAGELIDDLRRAGAEVVVYRPLTAWLPAEGWNRRDHRKILVVDHLAFTGGLNIADEQAPVEDGGGGWLDVHARVEGPIVCQLADLFRDTWIAAGGRPFPKRGSPALESAAVEGSAFALALGNQELRRRRVIRRAYLRAMRRARRTISIMNAYFVPDRGIRRALRRAVRRGVDVQVIVPGRSDVKAAQYAGQWTFAGLLRSGVRILLWPDGMMHAKTAIVDSAWATIGSYNLDSRSLFHNLEVVIGVVDRGFGARMQARFDQVAAGSRELSLAEWARRPLWHRFREWLCYRFRHWL